MLKFKVNMLSILSIIFLIIGTILATISTTRYQNKSNDKREKIESLSRENLKLSEKIESISNRNEQLNLKMEILMSNNYDLTLESKILTSENKDLNMEIRKLSQSISQQSEIINNNITGGDSYCILLITPISKEEWEVHLIHEGKYTIKNVVLSITDEHERVKEFHKIEKNYDNPGENIIKWRELAMKCTTQYEIGNMVANYDNNAKTPYFIKNISVKDKNVIYHWIINISGDNGVFRQEFKLFYLPNGDLVHASQLKNSKGEILHQRISKRFPRDDNGNPEWYSN